ncbi:MAG TPA: hypothetical protein VMT10_02375 [Solirubrobacteraceae bacterium]|nr:hypothetical protein [Solirubrobacteraceae bacterium]
MRLRFSDISRVGLLLVACAAIFAAPSATPAAHAASVYWGANIGGQFNPQGERPPYNMQGADAFEALTGKRMSLMQFSLPWAFCDTQPCTFQGFPTAQMEAIRERGAIPVFGWASYSQPLSENEPDFKTSKIAAGDYDAFIRQWADQAKAWGHPFFLQFDWEMNLASVWPYVPARSGNAPGDFVRAWRHVHDIFVQEGATNATWAWCPNIEYNGSFKPLKTLYPGDAYVDWTCIDGYNWGTDLSGWESFSQTFGPTYKVVQAIAPDKPLLIGETASSEHGGNKAAWIKDMLDVQLPRNFPNVKGFVWFEQADKSLSVDWRIETSPAAQAAFAAGIRSPYYAENSFADVGAPIPPLSPVQKAGGTGGGASAAQSQACTTTTTISAGGRTLRRTVKCTARCTLRVSKRTHQLVRVCVHPRCVTHRASAGRRVRVCTSTRTQAAKP